MYVRNKRQRKIIRSKARLALHNRRRRLGKIYGGVKALLFKHRYPERHYSYSDTQVLEPEQASKIDYIILGPQ
jgi:hypothetical protein